MSASDAAPLPRLGEVFFDVRGSSRSMRLSWYADTGVAVFSIWQGGICTGTFRLPIADLPRMVEILERGPQGRERPAQAGPADYRTGFRNDQPDHGDPQDYPTGSYWQPDDGGYQRELTSAEYAADPGGYDEDRFVPPYVRGPGESYLNDNPVDPLDRQAGFGRPAYRGDRHQGRSAQYQEPPWAPGGYSDEPEYRLAADTATGARHSGRRRADSQARTTAQPGPGEADTRAAQDRDWQRDYDDRRRR